MPTSAALLPHHGRQLLKTASVTQGGRCSNRDLAVCVGRSRPALHGGDHLEGDLHLVLQGGRPPAQGGLDLLLQGRGPPVQGPVSVVTASSIQPSLYVNRGSESQPKTPEQHCCLEVLVRLCNARLDCCTSQMVMVHMAADLRTEVRHRVVQGKGSAGQAGQGRIGCWTYLGRDKDLTPSRGVDRVGDGLVALQPSN